MIFDIMPQNQKTLPFRLRKPELKQLKIPVSLILKQEVRRAKRKEKVTEEKFVYDILMSAFEREYLVDLPPVKFYENNRIYVSTWLSEKELDYIGELTDIWGVKAPCEAAYRIFRHEFVGGDESWQDAQRSI